MLPTQAVSRPLSRSRAATRAVVSEIEFASRYAGDGRRFEFSPPVALQRAAVGNERHEAVRGTEQRSADTAFSGAEDGKGAWGGVHRISAASG